MSPTPDRDRAITFSIITVTKNAARHIVACIDSIAAQTYPHVEHIVIDGVSTDDTVSLARARLRPTGRLISEPDQGIYDAMNRGIARATGDYLLFVGADDYLVDRNVLGDAAEFLAGAGWPDAIYGDIEVRDGPHVRTVFRPPDPDQALDLMICGCLPHQATFAHRSVFESKVGVFNTAYRVQSDYDWFLRLLTAPGVRIARFHRVVASFALGGASSRLQLGQEETYAIQNAFPIYRQPEWIERRLHAFQRELLAVRIQLQNTHSDGTTAAAPMARLRRTMRRLLDRLFPSPG